MGSTFLMLSPRTLPELDVSSVLQSSVVTRKAAASINGYSAALRLGKAKNELREILQQELDGPLVQLLPQQQQQRNRSTSNSSDARKESGSSSSYNTGDGAADGSASRIPSTKATPSTGNHNFGDVKKLYILRRHGVPNQLLLHLLTVADDWLEKKSALEVLVDSGSPSSLSVIATDQTSWRTVWPAAWDQDVTLYLATMKRMVSRLASVTTFCDAATNGVEPGELEWKISISRHNKLPLTLFPNDSEVVPVIEWVVPDHGAASTARKIGKIVVRLQGSVHPNTPTDQQDTCLKQAHDVSLIFEANFDMTDDYDLQIAGS